MQSCPTLIKLHAQANDATPGLISSGVRAANRKWLALSLLIIVAQCLLLT